VLFVKVRQQGCEVIDELMREPGKLLLPLRKIVVHVRQITIRVVGPTLELQCNVGA
jgi:hypothetical protein